MENLTKLWSIFSAKLKFAFVLPRSDLNHEEWRCSHNLVLDNLIYGLAAALGPYQVFHSVIHITTPSGSMVYTVDRLTMGRLSKVVLLAVLLIIAGFPGAASLLCAQPSGPHGHACCMAHEQANASHCAASSLAVSGTPSCCKMAPIESTPIQPILLSGVSHDSAYGLQATSEIAGALPAPALLLRRGFPLLTKLQHSPVHALLCTFLV
jgi:hypothetical protein